VSFPGNQFKGEIAPALAELVEKDIIRIVDILFINKDEDGNIDVVELDAVGDDESAAFGPVVSDLTDLLTEDDAERLSNALDNNSSAALMLFENTWATRLRDALLNANGQLVLNTRIPKHVVDEVLAGAQEAS
jgi:hypothetical protein